MPDTVQDIFAFFGLLSVGFGLWLIYPPVAFIVIGAAMVLLSVLSARKTAPEMKERAE